MQRTALLDLPLDGELFKVLASDTRRDILRLLHKRRMTVTEVASRTGLGKPTVSEHLKRLREAGLIERHEDPERVWVYHSLTPRGRSLLEPERARFTLVLGVAVAGLAAGVFVMLLAWASLPASGPGAEPGFTVHEGGGALVRPEADAVPGMEADGAGSPHGVDAVDREPGASVPGPVVTVTVTPTAPAPTEPRPADPASTPEETAAPPFAAPAEAVDLADPGGQAPGAALEQPGVGDAAPTGPEGFDGAFEGLRFLGLVTVPDAVSAYAVLMEGGDDPVFVFRARDVDVANGTLVVHRLLDAEGLEYMGHAAGRGASLGAEAAGEAAPVAAAEAAPSPLGAPVAVGLTVAVALALAFLPRRRTGAV